MSLYQTSKEKREKYTMRYQIYKNNDTIKQTIKKKKKKKEEKKKDIFWCYVTTLHYVT